MKGESLTENEKNYMFQLKMWPHDHPVNASIRCPACGDLNQFLLGARGGMSRNIMCNTCKSKFNVCPPYFAERI